VDPPANLLTLDEMDTSRASVFRFLDHFFCFVRLFFVVLFLFTPGELLLRWSPDLEAAMTPSWNPRVVTSRLLLTWGFSKTQYEQNTCHVRVKQISVQQLPDLRFFPPPGRPCNGMITYRARISIRVLSARTFPQDGVGSKLMVHSRVVDPEEDVVHAQEEAQENKEA